MQISSFLVHWKYYFDNEEQNINRNACIVLTDIRHFKKALAL